MPIQPTYPGVYVQEISSGVRTITGVSTSIAAFLGSAKRGPINRSVLITSFSDFERRFGGLSTSSEMSYAVRQFFMNGGTQAIITRLAGNPVAASTTLHFGTNVPTTAADEALTITALDQGSGGNQIEIRVDFDTANPDSTFNLYAIYISSDNPSDSISESHLNLSMNSNSPRYVENIVGRNSELIAAVRTPASLTTIVGTSGTAGSGVLGTVGPLIDATHDRIRIIVNGIDPVVVQLSTPVGGSDALRLDDLCDQIETSVQNQANGNTALSGFTCTASAATILMTSGEAGENSYVEVLPGLTNDAAARLQLGVGLGGTQIDAVANIRPRESPARSSWTSGDIDDGDVLGPPLIPLANLQTFYLSIDGRAPSLIDIGLVALPAGFPANVIEIANRIQQVVRNLRPSSPAYSGFTCTAEDGTIPVTDRKLVLSSGTRGSTSSIAVSENPGDTLAARLKLLPPGTTTVQASNQMLAGGTESPITSANAYGIYVGSRANRQGIYALESADLFNIMCLPGVDDPGILMEAEAYCKERRAFFIIDAPVNTTSPNNMITLMAGASLPKSNYAAVYYPWIRIADPLNGGALRRTAPSGTIAGLYARIDSSRGVWKAPAGTEATLTGVQGLEYKLTDRENGTLNPIGVNCLRIFPATGGVSWGARTLQGSDQAASEWKYIPVRRLALFMEESLFRGLQWVVFEPNDEPLWAQIRLNVGAFMHNLFRQGAFQGQKKTDAYFVKCDSETTTQNDINLGIVNIIVGFAPLKPAEFVILSLQQMAGQIES